MSNQQPTLEFKDLSNSDLMLIKDRAVRKFADTKCGNAQDAMIEIVFEMIRSKGFDIVKTDREPTWSNIGKSHFTEGPRHNNWWKE